VADLTFVVSAADTAMALGSGDVDVLATPRLLAWLEAATVAAAAERVGPGQTSVGTRVEVEHLAASRVGAAVTVRATLAAGDGRLLRFTVAAEDDAGRRLATGTITRVVVDRVRFLAGLGR